MSKGATPVVVIAADGQFVKQLAVAIGGISSVRERSVNVFVLHDGFAEIAKAQVAEAAGKSVSIFWLDARSSEFEATKLPSYLPVTSLFRLRIGDLLPEDCERAIYLDADVVVREPLDALWETDLDEHLIGAVRDPVVPWAAAPIGLPWTELHLSASSPYFNAGVLL